jgi:hypothetical protein
LCLLHKKPALYNLLLEVLPMEFIISLMEEYNLDGQTPDMLFQAFKEQESATPSAPPAAASDHKQRPSDEILRNLIQEEDL